MRATAARRGVTLIEMLVVIAIFIALAAMIAAAAPRFGERQGTSRGAAQLQSWLNLARQMAIRDQRPRGIRIVPPRTTQLNATPADANYARELQYIEQPDDFRAGIDSLLSIPSALTTGATPPDYSLIRISDYTRPVATGVPPPVSMPYLPTAANSTPRDPEAPVQVGDVLLITDKAIAGPPRRIVDVWQQDANPATPPRPKVYFVRLDQPLVTPDPMSAPNWPQYDTEQYVIYRQPRPMAGEPPLQLPKDVGIDFSRDPNPTPANSTNYAWYRFSPKLPTGGGSGVDILFHPNGYVLGSAWAGTSRIVLWVHGGIGDPDFAVANKVAPDQLPPGDNTLVTIYTRAGTIAAHPVDPSGLVPGANTWNPFRFTQDSQSSGQ